MSDRAVLSTGHYRRYNNPVLLQLDEMYPGIKIGAIGIQHITVADDLALFAEKQVGNASNGLGC